MQMYYEVFETAEVAIDSTGDKATYTPGAPVDIVRVGIVGTTSYTHGSGAIVKVDKNASDGDGTYTRGDGDVAEVTVDSGFNAGLVNYVDLDEPVELDPGDQAIVQVTQAASAGDGVVFMEYRKRPFVSGSPAADEDRLVNATDVTA